MIGPIIVSRFAEAAGAGRACSRGAGSGSFPAGAGSVTAGAGSVTAGAGPVLARSLPLAVPHHTTVAAAAGHRSR